MVKSHDLGVRDPICIKQPLWRKYNQHTFKRSNDVEDNTLVVVIDLDIQYPKAWSKMTQRLHPRSYILGGYLS